MREVINKGQSNPTLTLKGKKGDVLKVFKPERQRENFVIAIDVAAPNSIRYLNIISLINVTFVTGFSCNYITTTNLLKILCIYMEYNIHTLL